MLAREMVSVWTPPSEMVYADEVNEKAGDGGSSSAKVVVLDVEVATA